MKVQIICFTDNAENLSRKLAERLYETDIRPDIYRGKHTSDIVSECFKAKIPLIFISACGIAVRFIAPYVKDKLEDIPVVVMDELGRFVIPILSGHVGGGNALADRLAALTGATNVTTTATDINNAFAPDVFAADNRLDIRNRENIKKVASGSLTGKPVLICVKDYPPDAPCDILISDEYIKGNTLWLSPKKYVLGIGCKKGKTVEEIEAAAQMIFDEAGIDYRDIYAFGSIDLKAQEEGLLDLSAKHGIPFVTFPADMMKKAQGEFTPSSFVEEVTGVDNVCERAAVLLTCGHGRLVIKKTAKDGVTMALAIKSAL